MRLLVRFAVILLLLLGGSLLLPAAFHGPYPHPPGPVFDAQISRRYLHEIEQQRPRLVLLGDSMLTKDVDLESFQSLSGVRSYKLDIPGASSALWYLVLKTNIGPAQPAPRTVVILFRDTMLTAASFRTTGPYLGMIDKFAAPEDALLIERAYLAQMSPLQAALERYFPPYTYRLSMRDALDARLRHAVPALRRCDGACADAAMSDVLGDVSPELFARSIRQAEQVLYTPGELDFAARVDSSFLPAIIELSKAGGIRLIFVRAPTNVFPDLAEEPEGLKQYFAALTAYLAERNVPLLDLSRAEGIGPAQFVDPHHMTLEGKATFTRLLADALKSLTKMELDNGS
jgi:hypothetical protein